LTLGYHFKEEGINFIKAESVTTDGRIDESKFASIDEETDKKLRRSRIEEGDILFSIAGMKLGKSAVVEARHVPANTNQALAIIRIDRSKATPRYVHYHFLNPTYYDYVNRVTAQSAQPNINLTQVGELPIRLPPLPTQRKIAAVLSAYDDLIENNMQRIKILEEMAQLIYREWFVKFRFPGHKKIKLVDSPMGKIPQGWEVKKVGETFEILGGGTPSKQREEYWAGGTIMWYVPSDLTAAGTMFMDRSSTQITELGLRKSSARIFPPFCVMMTSRATLGVIAINTTPACTNQGFITCMPNEHIPLFCLYFWLRENTDTFASMASGATFKEITKGVFKTIDILVPPPVLVTKFQSVIEPLAQNMLNLQRRNDNLRRTRNLLLPKLISGELDVSELDIKV
jgi:type I restriction enzyme S subunit